MLSNAYFLAKFRFDTAENEPAKKLQNFAPPRGPAPRRPLPGLCRGLGLAKLAKLANFLRARSRLYQNENLQENMRLTAFFKLYKICTRLHRYKHKGLAKLLFGKSAILMKFQTVAFVAYN